MSKQTQGIVELTLRADKINKKIKSLSTKPRSTDSSSRSQPSYRGSDSGTKDKAYCL